jgi:NAD(P)-dependent dehydrogenase (short-subunit alcohol dehydrogenase family)
MPAVALAALVDDGVSGPGTRLQPRRHPSTQVVEVHGGLSLTAQIWVDVRTFDSSRMLELNLLGVVRCCRAAIPYLRRSAKNPAIVNVSSVNALAALAANPIRPRKQESVP